MASCPGRGSGLPHQIHADRVEDVDGDGGLIQVQEHIDALPAMPSATNGSADEWIDGFSTMRKRACACTMASAVVSMPSTMATYPAPACREIKRPGYGAVAQATLLTTSAMAS